MWFIQNFYAILWELINLSVAWFLLNLSRSTIFYALEEDRETHCIVKQSYAVRWHSHSNIKILLNINVLLI